MLVERYGFWLTADIIFTQRKARRGSRWRTYELTTKTFSSAWLNSPDYVNQGWRYAPTPTCYAIYVDGCLVYIGSTIDLRKRVGQHGIRVIGRLIHTPWGIGKIVHVKAKLSRKFGDWLMDEVRLIQRLQPTGNRAICRAVVK